MTLKNLCPVFTKIIIMMLVPISALFAQSAYPPKLNCELKNIPNIITPNGDNNNETFCLPCELSGWHLKICNRWGKVIYENHNYKNEWNGGGFSSGVYYYYLKHSRLEKAVKGWVAILY